MSNVRIKDENRDAFTVTASSTVPVDLFNANGTYKVSYAEIVKGYKFNVFGKVWTVVAKNDSTKEATFWMDSTIGIVKFTNYYQTTKQ